MICVYHYSMQILLETTSQSKKHMFLKYFTGAFWWCLLKKLSWFLALLMSIAYLQHFSKLYQIKNYILICTQTEHCKLWCWFLQAAPFKRKKGVVWSPVLYCRLSFFVRFALVCKLHTYIRIMYLSFNPNTYICA